MVQRDRFLRLQQQSMYPGERMRALFSGNQHFHYVFKIIMQLVHECK